MKTRRYVVQDGRTELLYGSGLVNSLAYLLEGFRGWCCYGIVIEHRGIGLRVEDRSICAVYGIRESVRIESDEAEREQAMIDCGETAVVLFYGIDNSSYMRRMTPNQFDLYSVSEYRYEPGDLFYNS